MSRQVAPHTLRHGTALAKDDSPVTHTLRSALTAACLTLGLLVALPAPAAVAVIDPPPGVSPGVVAERPRDAAVHAVDGEVRGIAQVGNTVVMGGSFTKIGPATRGAVGMVDTAAKTFQPGFPDVVGAVTTVLADGAGGWFLGGSFSSVGGQARTNLARVDASGAVTSFAPAASGGTVNDLVALPGGDLVVGGSFTSLAGSAAGGLGRVSPTGSLVWGTSVTNGAVRTVAVSADGARVYLGGDFTKIAGSTRNRLGAVNTSTGQLDAGFVPGTVNLGVNDMVVHSGALLLVGDFTAVNGTNRNRVARVNGVSGALDGLNVNVNNSVKDVEVDTTTNTAYIAGTFGMAGGVARLRLAGINLTTSAVTALNVPNITGNLSTVTLDGAGGLYIGGAMQITPEKGNPGVLARVAISTGAVTAVVPYAEAPRSLARQPVTGSSGGPLALVRSGTSLLVAGDFSDYGLVTRNGLAAYDLATGALRSDFDPAPNGAVNTVKASADAQSVFVGGAFTTIAGATHQHLARLAIGTGAPVPGFRVTSNSFVKDLAVRTDGTALYVGGNFDAFNGAQANKLVAINAATGQTRNDFTMPLTEQTNDLSEGGLRAMALSSDQTRLMVIGNFRRVGGRDRPLMAQIDVSTSPATVTQWRTDVYDQPCSKAGQVGFMRDVDISPDGATAYVVTSGHFYYPACDTVNAFSMEADADAQPTWTKKIGDTLESVTVGPDAVYISGHFRYLDTETLTQARFHIGALDPATGDGLSWAPNASGFRGVLTVELEPGGLFAGGDSEAFGLGNHGRNAFWPTPAPGIDVRKTPSRPWVAEPSGPVAHTVRVRNTFPSQAVTITTLSDERLGSLAASGDCSLPQTIEAGQAYTCTTAAETVSGTAPTDVRATLTASGTASDGAAVAGTDRSVVEVIVPPAMFRMRATVGPGVLPFPGGPARFNVTMMNLDPVRPATVTSLVSPTFGDVSSECGLPRSVGPDRLINCHLDLEVSGPVGSVPSFPFTGTATFGTGDLTSTVAPTVTITPPAGGTKVLAVVADPELLSASDNRVEDSVEDGFSITYADDDSVQPADVTSDYSYVVLYPSVVEAKLGTRLRELDRPVMVLHSRMLDEMGMTAAGQNGSTTAATTTIAKPMHPLSAALSGTVTVDTAPIETGYGVPTSAATVITQLDASRPTEFLYAAGSELATGAAPACRVFFSANNTTQFTPTAWALFNRAAAYTSTKCGKHLLWTAAGNGTAAYGGADGRTSTAVGLHTPWGLAIDSHDRVYVADAALHAVRRIDTDGTVTTFAGIGKAGFSGDGGPAASARLSTPIRLAFDAADNLYIADAGNNRIRKVTPSGTISTVAGSGIAGSAGDGAQATAAQLRSPVDMTVAANGTMYIADRSNHRIRRVTPAGIISTYAGTGTAGYTADGVAATSSRLNSPHSVDLDAAGNLYIADYDNERVRMVETNGTIRTVAGTGVAAAEGDGGPAVDAGLHKPQYVTVGPDGDLYISESNGNRIRQVHDGLITTLAGSGVFGYLGDGASPLFSTWQRPSATAFDSGGNLWVADRGNRRIRVIAGN